MLGVLIATLIAIGGLPHSGAHSIHPSFSKRSTPIPSIFTDASGRPVSHQGCYSDSLLARTFTGTPLLGLDVNTMTIGRCLDACLATNYPLAGLSNGNACFCGTYMPAASLYSPNACVTSCAGDGTHTCGGSAALSIYGPAFPLNNYQSGSNSVTFAGCIQDGGASMRSFPNTTSTIAGSSMTIQACVNYCISANFAFSGLEYAQECYCGSTMPNVPIIALGKCNYGCNGDDTTICGGPDSLSVYTTSRSGSLSNIFFYIDNNLQPVTYQGCFSDVSSSRTLTGSPAAGIGLVTVQSCALYCSLAGFPVSGAENGSQCYCGSSMPSLSLQISSASCQTACAGNSSSICGGPNALSVYSQTLLSQQVNYNASSPLVSYLGCGSISTVPAATTAYTSNSTATIDSCASLGLSGAYKSFSVSGGACYLYNSIPTFTSILSTCNVICGGNSLKYCGSPDATTYQFHKISTATGILPNYQDVNFQTVSFANCYSDSATSRTLTGAPSTGISGSSMTVQQCAYACSQNNFPVSGVEYGGECYCGPELPSGSLIISSTASTGCSMACNGDSSTFCGGANALSVYTQKLLSQQVNYNTTVTNASYTGCGTVSTVPSVLTVTAETNTPDVCGSLAAANGYRSYAPSGSSACNVWAVAIPLSGISSSCAQICGGNSLKYCGSATAGVYQVYSIATNNLPTTGVAMSTTYTTVNGQTFTYQGCFADNSQARMLTSSVLIGPNTILACITLCSNQGFIYAGVEYGAECWCGNAQATTTSAIGCIMACKGDGTTSCGGPNAIQVYKSSSFTGFTATTPNVKGEVVSFLGCYADSVNARIFSVRIQGLGPLTPTLCTTACSAKFQLSGSGVPISYPFAGLQYGNECWCNSAAPSAAAIQTILCTAMPCAGAAGSWCGGGNRMAVYQSAVAVTLSPLLTYGAATHQGCYATAARNTPSQYTVITAGSAQLNAEYCITACSSLGFMYAGLQGASSSSISCTCSQAVNLGTAAAAGSCNTACSASGFAGEQCGGNGYTNVFKTNVAGSALAIAGGSAATFATAGTFPTTASFYVGCYVDSNPAARVLNVKANLAGVANSPALCISACAGMNLQFAGVEYGVECWCGSALPTAWTGNPQTAAFGAIGDCNMACPGQTGVACGAGYRLSVYSTGGTVTAPTIQSAVTGFTSAGGGTSSYNYLGCYPDNYPTSRTLKNAVVTVGGNIPQTCATACFAAGYKYAGLEFSVECYCSNIMSPIGGVAVTANTATPSPCNLPCGGDSTKICGGSNFLTVYQNTGMAPINLAPYAVNGVTWTYQACWREPSGGRALANPLNNSGKTIQGCLALAGTTYNTCGIEYGGECWCGNAFPTTGTQISEAYCSSYRDSNGNVQTPGMVCTGNTLQWCGAGNVLNIYATYTPSPAITPITTAPS